jgi:CubicO group peptidase (beta-lactamase class C family)
VEKMTRKQTGDGIEESYGLGLATGVGSLGHGGAYATNMTIDPRRGLVYVFMVQHAGFPRGGEQSLSTFQKAAEQRFSGPE